MSSEQEWTPLPSLSADPRGRRPGCGHGRLFSAFLSLRFHGEACGMDCSYADPAEGPAFFVVCCVCIPTVIPTLWIEARFGPSRRVHLVTTLPFLLLTGIPHLQPLKGWLMVSRTSARTGSQNWRRWDNPTACGLAN
ncbi:DUF983 domain-containing protein [Azospirillum argentinense]